MRQIQSRGSEFKSGTYRVDFKHLTRVLLPLLCIDNKDVIIFYSWYHGRMNRSAAEKILGDSNKSQCFLVRESMSKPGVYVLSYLGASMIAAEYSHFRYSSTTSSQRWAVIHIKSLCQTFYSWNNMHL